MSQLTNSRRSEELFTTQPFDFQHGRAAPDSGSSGRAEETRPRKISGLFFYVKRAHYLRRRLED
jgi:hypothetical protein